MSTNNKEVVFHYDEEDQTIALDNKEIDLHNIHYKTVYVPRYVNNEHLHMQQLNNLTVNTQTPASHENNCKYFSIQKQIGGAHGALVTAVSPIAFKQAVGMLRRGGTCVLNGLPPGEFPVSIFDVVLNGYTIRGSIVGTRLDLEQALAFAAEGKVKATIETLSLESINDVFSRLKKGQVNGRVVLSLKAESSAKPAIDRLAS